MDVGHLWYHSNHNHHSLHCRYLYKKQFVSIVHFAVDFVISYPDLYLIWFLRYGPFKKDIGKIFATSSSKMNAMYSRRSGRPRAHSSMLGLVNEEKDEKDEDTSSLPSYNAATKEDMPRYISSPSAPDSHRYEEVDDSKPQRKLSISFSNPAFGVTDIDIHNIDSLHAVESCPNIISIHAEPTDDANNYEEHDKASLLR